MLKQSNESYEKKIHRPLAERKVFPQTLNFSTTAEALHVVGLEAGADQLAAPDEPPALADADADTTLRVHESTINNAAAAVLPGMILPEATFQAAVTYLFGKLPKSLESDPNALPWTIVFADVQPFTVSFADDGFRVALRATKFFRGDAPVPVPATVVTATYKFEKKNGVLTAVRKDLEILPLHTRELSARFELQQKPLRVRFNKVFAAEYPAAGFTPKGKWAAVGKLQPVELRSACGWLLVSWRCAAGK